MAIVLKTGPEYFFVNENDTISMRYDPHINKYFKYKDKQIPSKNIYIQDGGQIIFKDEAGEKYIIDDGYRTKLISAGYLNLLCNKSILDITDEDKSITIRELLLKAFKSHVNVIKANKRNSALFMQSRYDYDFIIEIESINKLIDRNMRRQKMNLPLYPTERGQDKKGLYFRIYSMKNNNSEDCIILRAGQIHEVGMQILDKFISDIMISTSDTIDIVLNPSNHSDNHYYLSINELPINKTIIRYETEL